MGAGPRDTPEPAELSALRSDSDSLLVDLATVADAEDQDEELAVRDLVGVRLAL